MKNATTTPFLSDVEELRSRARASIKDGAVTPAYQANVKETIEVLQTVLATEIVCVLRYTMNAVAAAGISSDSVKKEFDEHAKEEQAAHARGRRAHQSARRNTRLQSGRIGHTVRIAIRGGR